MANAVVVLNAGSSSIKFALFMEQGKILEARVQGQVEGLYTRARFVSKAVDGEVKAENSWPVGFKLGHEGALDHLIGYLRSELKGDRLIGMGHRVVHGGLAYTQPVRVDREVLKVLETFVPLAPLHQPHNLTPIRIALERVPELPQVACFDTSFHRTQPEVAQLFALPHELRKAGVMRYGFHGLSYQYIASALPEIAPDAAIGKTIVLHLGNGSSMCALDGRTQHCQHHGVHGGRGPADGHPLRLARSRGDPVPHRSARDDHARSRRSHLQPVGAARCFGHFQRHAHSAGKR